MTADEILKKSDEVMAGLQSYRAYKSASVNTDWGLDTEKLVKRVATGEVYVKTTMLRNGRPFAIEWILGTNRYHYEGGVLIQIAFKNTNWISECIASCPTPFVWHISQDEVVGTNECVVVVGKATEQLLSNARLFAQRLWPGFPSEEIMAKFPVERRVYIRKSNAVQIGWKEMTLGGEIRNYVFDTFDTSIQVPESAFILPSTPMATATNLRHFVSLITGVEAVHDAAPSRIKRWVVLGLLLACSAIFGVIIYRSKKEDPNEKEQCQISKVA